MWFDAESAGSAAGDDGPTAASDNALQRGRGERSAQTGVEDAQAITVMDHLPQRKQAWQLNQLTGVWEHCGDDLGKEAGHSHSWCVMPRLGRGCLDDRRPIGVVLENRVRAELHRFIMDAPRAPVDRFMVSTHKMVDLRIQSLSDSTCLRSPPLSSSSGAP